MGGGGRNGQEGNLRRTGARRGIRVQVEGGEERKERGDQNEKQIRRKEVRGSEGKGGEETNDAEEREERKTRKGRKQKNVGTRVSSSLRTELRSEVETEP